MPTIINDISRWYHASGFQDASIAIPPLELTILLALLTVGLLLRFSRAGLIIAYIFVYRWSWSVCSLHGIFDGKSKGLFLTGYIVFGIIVLTLTVVGMMIANRSPSNE